MLAFPFRYKTYTCIGKRYFILMIQIRFGELLSFKVSSRKFKTLLLQGFDLEYENLSTFHRKQYFREIYTPIFRIFRM